MPTDSVVDEVRAAREAYASRFGFDLVAIGRDLQERERAGGWVVLLPPAAGEGFPPTPNQALQPTGPPKAGRRC